MKTIKYTLAVAVAIASLAVLALPSTAHDAKGCIYAGKTYSDGSECCQSGLIKRCNDGSWVSTGTKC
jgi:hypothetical protein